MAQDNEYEPVEVESYFPVSTSGLHGKVHIRPVAGGNYPTTMHVECSKDISRLHPVGSRFRIMAKLTDRLGKGEFLYSSWRWPYTVLFEPEGAGTDDSS
ncbi:MAG: hypothetical protein KKG69_05690 [Alphaproteobacteria bacterium]|uniref:hypothetical protein n=1 Tax=Brevundimonas sp. TaxID=1871086 RepID=UPI0035612A18|nr:hypothetical protein [Alphaproteobacteria bacterium]MBU2163537.1 hypothetical protein [Alphaproteobacteria bacterium]MBU2230751.1 hypothetical protein [Alphaproteobacteria bacterium]